MINQFIKYIFFSFLILLLFDSCSFKKNIHKGELKHPDSIDILNVENLKKIILNNDRVILRDSWGVPHIYGTTDKDAAFALAYAHAQDDFYTIQEALLKARGIYASVYGKGENGINAIFDYMVGLLKVWDNVNEKYNTDLSPETIELCEGYADGINYYIENHSNDIKQYIYPVTGKDVIAGTVHKIPFFFQLPLFLADLYDKSPEDIPNHYTIGEELDKIKGSNVYAISKDKTNNNNTFLAINSHQPFNGELAWYEAHINSKEGWNMLGGLFPGSPVVLVGHNNHLGWGHTVNKPDILDIYELEINPENENQYRFDNKWYDFEEYDVSISVKTIGKLQYNHVEPAFWSIHGPVIKGEKATYAIRYSNMDDIRNIEQWYKMNKAKNYEEWLDAMKMISIPMFNSGYADKKGNIFYLYSAKFPIRNENYDWQKVLPGNTSETLWHEYDSFENLPQIMNPSSGFIQNCNNTPFYTTKGKDNLDSVNFNMTYGIETAMTNRGLRALETFGENDKITYDKFKEYKYDLHYSKQSTMNKLVSKSIELLDKNNFPDLPSNILSNAKNTLKNWNLSTDKENKNAPLPIIAFRKLMDVPFNEINSETIIKQLNYSINYLLSNFNTLNLPWGQINRLIRGDQNLSLDGGPDIARAIYTEITESGELKATAGDSYILLVRWNNNGKAISESIHQFGSATTNQSSKHYSNQSKIFSENKLKKISIYLDDILEDVEEVIVLDKAIN